MKTICLTMMGAVLATSVIAQDNTNSLPAIPAPATSPAAESAPASAPTPEAVPAPNTMTAETNAAPAKPKKRVVRHRIHEPKVSLVPGQATIASEHVNVRGQAGVNGEVIAHEFKGDTVTVLDQINLKKHASDEPAQWAKVTYPTNASIWVFAKYIDSNNTVSTKKVNLRAGPGENFSTVGILNSGDPVTPIETKGRWMKIQAPTNSYAFIAAMYLTQSPEQIAAANTPPTPTEVEQPPTPVMTQVPPQPQTGVNIPPTVPTPAPVPNSPENMPEVSYNNNLPRVVSHEGVVRHVGSLITPTAYELYSLATDKNIDFLYTTSTNLDLSKYIGMQIIVTGEEDLAARWDIPVLTIQQIIVVNTNAVPNQIYLSPRQQQERGNH
ncbi:MAG TPA: SH3 domain-containing protein [Verrucomicrobiae bacterium]